MRLQGRVALATLAVVAGLCVQQATADVIYRETFGRPPGNEGGDLSTNVFGWADFVTVAGAPSGVFNTNNGASGINGSTNGRPVDVANVNAGANSDGTFGAYAHGIHFYTTAATAPILTYTPEYSVDPDLYTDLTFSWHQGNANAADSMRLAVQVGGQWYAHATPQTTAGMSLGNFPTQAELKTVAYDPAAANWLSVTFDGTYDHVTNVGVDSTVGLALGGVAAADLSGTITAFGVLVEGTASTRRFDTFQIEGNLIPEPTSAMLAVLGMSAVGWRRRR